MGLLEELKKRDKKKLFAFDDITDVSFKTGFKILDYANGYWKAIKDIKTGIKNISPKGYRKNCVIFQTIR